MSLFGLLTGGLTSALAQSKATVFKDSSKTDFVSKMQAFAKKEALESANDFAADKAVVAQGKILSEIKKTMQSASVYLKGGIDTAGAAVKLKTVERDFITTSDGVLINKDAAQTFRNLTATSKIFTELIGQTNDVKVKLDKYEKTLTDYRYRLDSLLSMPDLFKFPNDSAKLAHYLQLLIVTAHQVHPVDSTLQLAGNNVQKLINQVEMTELKIQGGLEEVERYSHSMATSTFAREFGDIWSARGQFRPMNEILTQAQAKGVLLLSFYVLNNIGKLVVTMLLIIICFVYLRSLKSIYIEKGLLDNTYNGQLVLKSPLFSALLIVTNVFQFIFLSPPFILNVIFWTITSISLSVLFYKYVTRYWMNVWLTMVVLFLLSAGDNLILQASRTERWFMLILSILGTVIGTWVWFTGKREELREKWITIAIAFMAILEFAATLANCFGRYNLSKTLLISGYLNVVVAILFLWTVRLINEGLYLAFHVYEKQDKKLFYLNFAKVGERAPFLFYVVLVVGWLILFGRNFAGFEYLAGPIQEFFARQRMIGDYDFTINNLLLFFTIIGVSVLISKIVSFFASDEHRHSSTGKKRPGVGSWLLLIRITILGIGLFIAIAAAGIPVDRIAIILGALGVGIGFGLQTLVNNLVSGLIIAFEKPVNVGDVVDIEGHSGTMKSIGFRSSVIYTADGADMVIPNGDLLNSHLTNWSLGGSRKRTSILIGIAYDADLQKAKQLLNEILASDERIATNPAPVVQYEEFGNNGVEIRIYFWTKHMSDAQATRGDLIMRITDYFHRNGIEIPFPQKETHIQTIENPTGHHEKPQ